MFFISRYRLQLLTLMLVFTLSIPYGVSLTFPPPLPKSKSSEFHGFQQMMQNIERWTQAPHWSGSAELERIRHEIVQEIENMGLVAKVDSYNSGKIRTSNIFEADESGDLWVHNILVKLDAPQSNHPFLFVSHYDGSDDPSAADDMLAVCAMLEALRSLVGRELQNSIYFLFTDGEEVLRYASGASHVLKDYPEFVESVSLVMNLEGSSGRACVSIVESSENNMALLQLYKEIGLYEYGSSLIADVIMMAGKSGDMYHFLQAGMRGLNMAALGDGRYYHTPLDSYENLNADASYHYYDTVLKLATYLTMSDIPRLDATDNALFFPVTRGSVQIIPVRHAFIVVATLYLCSIALLIAFRRRQLSNATASRSMKNLTFIVIFSTLLIWLFPNSLQHFITPMAALLIHTLMHWKEDTVGLIWDVARFLWALISGSTIMILYVPVLYQFIVLRIFPLPLVVVGFLVYLAPCFLTLSEIKSSEAIPMQDAIIEAFKAQN